MKKVFDDYDYKNVDTRVRLSLAQSKESYLSPWELSNFISNFNTYYYKAEVLNTIAIALKEDINPENILIFDESFKLNQQYSKLSEIGLNSKDLKYIYTLGKPITLFPNTDIFILHLLFKYFRTINEFLYQVNAKRLYLAELYYYYQSYQNDSFEILVNKLKKHTSEKLKKIRLKEKQLMSYDKIFDSITTEYNKYIVESKSFSHYNNRLQSKNWLADLKTDDEIFKRHYVRFFNLLINVQRPVVAIYNRDINSITILCRAHINKQQRNSVTLNLKSITHNSPIKAIIDGGMAIVDGAIKGYKTYKSEKREDELHKQKIQQINELHEYEKRKKEIELEREEHLLDTLKEENNLKLTLKSVEVLTALEDLGKTYELRAVSKLKDSFIQNKLKEIESKNFDNTKKLLDRNMFEVNEVSIIDDEEI